MKGSADPGQSLLLPVLPHDPEGLSLVPLVEAFCTEHDHLVVLCRQILSGFGMVLAVNHFIACSWYGSLEARVAACP